MKWLKWTLKIDTPEHIVEPASLSSPSWVGSTKCLISGLSLCDSHDIADDIEAASIRI